MLAEGWVVEDSLELQVLGIEVDVLTGIYSEETHLPQPLRIDVTATLDCPADPFTADMPLSHSKNYMHLKAAVTEALPRDRHFTLIEAVADHIVETLLVQDARVRRVEVKIVKLALTERAEQIGIRMVRHRR